MRILETSNDFRNAIYRILQAKPRYLYLASYGIQANSEFFKKLIKNVPVNTKLIVGLNIVDKKHEWLQKYLEQMHIDVRVVSEFHGKMVVSDKGVIIGGRNLTDSAWEDYSFYSSSEKTIAMCKKAFEKSWRNAK